MPTLFDIICLLGIIGNSLVICTVLKKSSPSSSVSGIFTISLSMVDLLFLLGMPFPVHQLLGNGAWRFGETICTIITSLDANSQFTSTYILIAMFIDRYLAAVYPFTSARFRKRPVAILIMCLLWALSFLSITPVWMYTQLIPLPGGLLGCGIHLPDPQRNIYWYTLCQFFLVFAIPFAIITVAYRRILLKMARCSEVLMSQRGNRARTRKLTRTAIAICMAFFICWAPFHILQLAQFTMTHPTLPFYYAYNMAISLGYANSCLNPFIYIMLGPNKVSRCRTGFPTWEQKLSGDTTECAPQASYSPFPTKAPHTLSLAGWIFTWPGDEVIIVTMPLLEAWGVSSLFLALRRRGDWTALENFPPSETEFKSITHHMSILNKITIFSSPDTSAP